jgi:hypothetical protein
MDLVPASDEADQAGHLVVTDMAGRDLVEPRETALVQEL